MDLKLLMLSIAVAVLPILTEGCGWQDIALESRKTYTIQSVNYPNAYPGTFHTCKFTGKAPPKHRIVLWCDTFELLWTWGCFFSYFAWSPTGDDHFYDAQYSCGRQNYHKETTGNHFAVEFANYAFNFMGRKGFHCEVEAIPTEPYTPPTTTTTTTTTTSTTTSKSTIDLPTPTEEPCECGTKITPKIVGGTESSINHYPWIVALKVGDHQFCGGALINDEWVMTASHCIDGDSAEDLTLALGDHDLSTETETNHVNVGVKQIIMHADYDTHTMDNDVALLQMARKVEFSQTIAPICLPYKFQDDDFHGKIVKVIGWGTTSSGGESSSKLLEIDLPVLLRSQCEKFDSLQGELTKNMICTYREGEDSCQGDSGGPLTYNYEDRNYLVGVVSWGYGCAQKGNPGVYAKVNNYLSWIQAKLGKSLCNPKR